MSTRPKAATTSRPTSGEVAGTTGDVRGRGQPCWQDRGDRLSRTGAATAIAGIAGERASAWLFT
jgi:hypothetical protein